MGETQDNGTGMTAATERPTKATLSVCGISPTMTEARLRSILGHEDAVLAVHIVRDRGTGLTKGFAFVDVLRDRVKEIADRVCGRKSEGERLTCGVARKSGEDVSDLLAILQPKEAEAPKPAAPAVPWEAVRGAVPLDAPATAAELAADGAPYNDYASDKPRARYLARAVKSLNASPRHREMYRRMVDRREKPALEANARRQELALLALPPAHPMFRETFPEFLEFVEGLRPIVRAVHPHRRLLATAKTGLRGNYEQAVDAMVRSTSYVYSSLEVVSHGQCDIGARRYGDVPPQEMPFDLLRLDEGDISGRSELCMMDVAFTYRSKADFTAYLDSMFDYWGGKRVLAAWLSRVFTSPDCAQAFYGSGALDMHFLTGWKNAKTCRIRDTHPRFRPSTLERQLEGKTAAPSPNPEGTRMLMGKFSETMDRMRHIFARTNVLPALALEIRTPDSADVLALDADARELPPA